MNDDFERANQAMHPVEKQWHYPTLTKYGFTPETKPQQGFVRSYIYTHPDGHTIRATTGAKADYWGGAGSGGYCRELEPFLKDKFGET